MTYITKFEELSHFKSRDSVPLKCGNCQTIFHRTKNRILDNHNRYGKLIQFCSQQCKGKNESLNGTSKCICNQCNKQIVKVNSQINENNFCSKSCAATYNNTHKTTGYRRSKLEFWLEQQLTILYPNLEIHYNKTDAINAELDIYIPSLKLAFELNGIFHYEPIYGKEKFGKTITNDKRKFQACLENGISLCIIDTSKQKYFKEKSSMEFCNIISSIIARKMAEAAGFEPAMVS